MSDGDVPFLSAFDKHLRKVDFRPYYLAPTEHLERAIRVEIGSERVVSGLANHEPRLTLEELLDRFDIDSPRSFVTTEMAYKYDYPKPSYEPYLLSDTRKPEYAPYVEELHRDLDFLDQLFASGQGGIPLQHQGGEILRRSVQAVANHYETPSIWVGFSPIDGESGFYRDESVTWEAIEEACYDELTSQQKKTAREYISSVRDRADRIESGPHPTSSLHSLRHKIRMIQRYKRDVWPFFERWIRGKLFKRVLGSYARWKYLESKVSHRIVKDSVYVFFPLQYYRESRVLVRAPAFYNQAWLIEYLSRTLPGGHELVVKDHPKQLGAQPKSAVDAITRFSHALDPGYSMQPIIENANVVVVLNNTVGYEAIIHGKQVVALGCGFYTGHRYTHDVTNITDLASTLKMAAESGNLTQEAVVEFTHGLLSGSREGVWGDTNEENLGKLSNSISEFHERR